MRIPEDKIEQIRISSDIVDVISASVNLKKRGKNYVGLCPFHQEKTPSFSVSAEKQMFYCFGCGRGGNVFSFIMETEKVSFIEAVKTLAERAGISLPAPDAADTAEATENEILYDACRDAGLFFHENLTQTVEGKLALEYFHHRGFTDETIRRFGLGYSMHAWDSLVKRSEARKVDLALIEKAGLIVRREDGSGYYDRFRGRAMFPIFSPSGRTIAFGARKLREDDQLAKYINSPETPIYSKSRNLYGLYQSREEIRGREYAVLVEGYADLISVFQAGIRNVVASSGTALTEEQIQLVGRYAKSIVLVYDADSAGSKATVRGVDLIIENDLEVRVAELPAGDDPDSFVKKQGGEAFQALIDNAVSFLDFKARLFQSQGILETPEGQTRAVRSIVETIAKMKDELKRNFYVKSVSEKYGIYETVLFRELEKMLARQQGCAVRAEARFAEPPPLENASVSTQEIPAPGLPATERDLLRLMLEYGNEMVEFVFEHIPPGQFTHPQARQVAQRIRQHADGGSGWDTSSLLNTLDDPGLKNFVADVTFRRYDISKGWAEMDAEPEEADPWEVAEKCLAIMRRQEIDRLLSENQRQMKEATARGEPLQEFLQYHQTLLQERKDLEHWRTQRTRAPSTGS